VEGTVSQKCCYLEYILSWMDDWMSLVGRSEIVGWGIILVARLAALSAISLLVIPIYDGTHLSSIFFEADFSIFWICCVVSFDGSGFWRAVRALSESILHSLNIRNPYLYIYLQLHPSRE